MNKLMGLALLAGAAAASAGSASAEVSANATLTSDYVFRGISQSDGGPAIQGSFDFAQGNFYAGVWGSNVDFGDGSASVELDAYVGVTPTTGPVNWDLSVVGYFYPNADDPAGNFDYFEGIAGASIDLSEQVTVGAKVAYTPEYFGETGNGIYYELNGAFKVNDAFSLSAAYGQQDVDDFGGSYDTWNLGGAYAVHGFTIDLRYHDTNDAFENGYVVDESNSNSRVVLTIGREL